MSAFVKLMKSTLIRVLASTNLLQSVDYFITVKRLNNNKNIITGKPVDNKFPRSKNEKKLV